MCDFPPSKLVLIVFTVGFSGLLLLPPTRHTTQEYIPKDSPIRRWQPGGGDSVTQPPASLQEAAPVQVPTVEATSAAAENPSAAPPPAVTSDAPVVSRPPIPASDVAALPTYMRKLEKRFNFSIATSFAAFTLDKALGPDGIMIHIDRRYARDSDDGIERKVEKPLETMRVLSTETIMRKYGLTNVQMTIAAMMAYAGLDDRAIAFPTHSPVRIEELLDFDETQRMLMPLNVVLLTDDEVALANLSRTNRMRAKKLKMSLGQRNIIGSLDLSTAVGALRHQEQEMHHTRRYRVFVQRNFFLSFPFRATVPFDSCFYIKRMVYHRLIRSNATELLTRIRRDYKAMRIMTVHLRLEIDIALLDAKGSAIQPDDVKKFFLQDVIPLARESKIDVIYICAGTLSKDFIAVLKALPFTILFKSDFPGIAAPPTGAYMVSSHISAAMDVLLLAHSTIAVTFLTSTLTLAVVSQRCPNPVVSGSYNKWRRDTMVKWSANISATSTLPPQSEEEGVNSGFFGYKFVSDGNHSRFSRLHYVRCGQTLGSQCFCHDARGDVSYPVGDQEILTPDDEGMTHAPAY